MGCEVLHAADAVAIAADKLRETMGKSVSGGTNYAAGIGYHLIGAHIGQHSDAADGNAVSGENIGIGDNDAAALAYIPDAAPAANGAAARIELLSSHGEWVGKAYTAGKNGGGILQGLPIELDDLILIGLLLFLLHDSDNNDPIMLVIIVFLILGDVF